MNALLFYLMQSSLCLFMLFLVYWIFLRRDTFFQMNRLFLILAGILSLLIPLLPFHRMMMDPVSALVIILDPVLITPDRVKETVIGHLQWFEIVWIVYFTGMTIFLIRYFVQILQIFLLLHRSKVKDVLGHKVVLVDRGYSPFSFFNMIFINESSIASENLEAILTHEQIHIRQAHSIDLLFGEILIIIQWFNPFAWLTQRELKNIHEYLADEGVLREGISTHDYQQLILNETMGIQVNNLSNNFNISQIKKRVTMITQKRSGNWAIGKILLALPTVIILGLLFGASSFPKTIITEKSKPDATFLKSTAFVTPDPQKKKFQVPDKQPSYPGGEEARIKFIMENIKYPEQAKNKKVQGKVFVTFNVETDGSITEVNVKKGIGSGCDEEAMRVVKMMPKWKPGELKGKPIVTNFILPFKFALN